MQLEYSHRITEPCHLSEDDELISSSLHASFNSSAERSVRRLRTKLLTDDLVLDGSSQPYAPVGSFLGCPEMPLHATQ